jgi:hypothetical protein
MFCKKSHPEGRGRANRWSTEDFQGSETTLYANVEYICPKLENICHQE